MNYARRLLSSWNQPRAKRDVVVAAITAAVGLATAQGLPEDRYGYEYEKALTHWTANGDFAHDVPTRSTKTKHKNGEGRVRPGALSRALRVLYRAFVLDPAEPAFSAPIERIAEVLATQPRQARAIIAAAQKANALEVVQRYEALDHDRKAQEPRTNILIFKLPERVWKSWKDVRSPWTAEESDGAELSTTPPAPASTAPREETGGAPASQAAPSRRAPSSRSSSSTRSSSPSSSRGATRSPPAGPASSWFVPLFHEVRERVPTYAGDGQGGTITAENCAGIENQLEVAARDMRDWMEKRAREHGQEVPDPSPHELAGWLAQTARELAQLLVETWLQRPGSNNYLVNHRHPIGTITKDVGPMLPKTCEAWQVDYAKAYPPPRPRIAPPPREAAREVARATRAAPDSPIFAVPRVAQLPRGVQTREQALAWAELVDQENAARAADAQHADEDEPSLEDVVELEVELDDAAEDVGDAPADEHKPP